MVDRLRGWNAFSNSSPVEGIEAAIRTFARPDQKMSIYVFGDELTGDSIEAVVRAVERMNRRGEQRKVRIHALGFPTMFSQTQRPEKTGVRFATLMLLDGVNAGFQIIQTIAGIDEHFLLENHWPGIHLGHNPMDHNAGLVDLVALECLVGVLDGVGSRVLARQGRVQI